MAELTVFSYRSGNTILHRLDVRAKIVFFVLISLSSLKAGGAGLALLTLALVGLFTAIRVSFISIFKELRYFFILLLFVWTARALSTPGSSVFSFKALTITQEGLFEGGFVCWRLLLTVMLGLLLISTTRMSELRSAIVWFLGPFPFIPAKRVGTMISLVVRFIPVIIDQAGETLDAQRARGVENRKNPVYRLVKFVMPLLRKTFKNADNLAIAMEARCYSEDRTGPVFSTGPADGIALMVTLCICVLMLTI